MESDWLWGLLGGLLIGAAAALYLLGNGRIMGVSGILGGLIDRSANRQFVERVFFLTGLIGAPALLTLTIVGKADTQITSNLAIITIAGLLVGLGTRIGNGCTSGHGVCGISRFSVRGIVATVVFIGSGAVTVFTMRVMGVF